MPKLELGGTAVLKVKDVSKIGAFLDMGLEKDLLLRLRAGISGSRRGRVPGSASISIRAVVWRRR